MDDNLEDTLLLSAELLPIISYLACFGAFWALTFGPWVQAPNQETCRPETTLFFQPQSTVLWGHWAGGGRPRVSSMDAQNPTTQSHPSWPLKFYIWSWICKLNNTTSNMKWTVEFNYHHISAMTTQLFTRQTHIHLLYNVICFVIYIMYVCKVRSLPVAITQYITLTLNIFQNKFPQSIIYYWSDNKLQP